MAEEGETELKKGLERRLKEENNLKGDLSICWSEALKSLEGFQVLHLDGVLTMLMGGLVGDSAVWAGVWTALSEE